MKLTNFFKRSSKQSVYISWILSYILITAVFVVACYGIYVGTKNVMIDEINSKHTYLLNQMQVNMDNFISEINNLGDDVILNEDISNFVNINNDFDGDRRYAVTKISKILNRYLTLYTTAADIFIYTPNNDFVISSKSSADTKSFYNMYFKDTSLSFADWKNIVTAEKITYKSAVARNDSGDNIPVIIFVKPLVSISLQKTNAYLVVMIDCDSLINVFDRSFENTDSAFYIIDSDNQILCENSVANSQLNIPNYSAIDKTADIFREKEYIYAYTTSTLTAWKFISLIPSNLIFNKLNYLLIIQIICLFGTVIFVVLLSIYFTKRNYAPIADIIDIIQSENDSSFSRYHGNEYEYIEKVLSKTFSEQKNYTTRLEKQDRLIKNTYFQNLLKGAKNTMAIPNYKTDLFDIEFVSDRFIVCLYYIDDCSSLFFEEGYDNDNNYEQSCFIITNVISELMNKSNVGYIIEIEDMLASVLNVDTANEADMQRLMLDIVEEAQKLAAESFNLHFSVAISQPCIGLPFVHTAYEDALSVMEFKVLTCNTGNLTLSDMLTETKYNYNYSNSLEQQLINSIKSGDFLTSQKIVDEIFNLNFEKTTPTLPFIQCLFFDITSTILKSVSEISVIYKEEFITNYIVLDNLIKCKTISEFKSEITTIIVKICDFINSKTEFNDDKFEMQITRFVLDHYNECDLSISTIAEHLNLSPNYVSTLFKEKTGSGLLKFINKIRLEKSLELLNDPNLKIKDIAELSGYANIRTFLSIFKKTMGITPSQYRENNQ